MLCVNNNVYLNVRTVVLGIEVSRYGLCGFKWISIAMRDKLDRKIDHYRDSCLFNLYSSHG